MKEEWRVIPESSNHAISNYGRMKKLSTGTILTPQVNKKGQGNNNDSMVYVIHNKDINNKKHMLRRAISICVMRAFRPDEYIEGKPIYRVDGNVNNNRVDNFRYEDKNALFALHKREDFLNNINKGTEWNISGDISDIRNKVKVTHLTCGNTYLELVGSVYHNGPYCRHCTAVRHNQSRCYDLSNKLEESSIGRFIIAGDLGKMDEPLSIKDNKYGREFTISKAKKFLRSGSTYKSPFDLKSQSIGEAMIEYMLMKENTSYYWQYYFNDCRNIKPLPFDFAIMQDGTPVYLVEYQGEQHYQSNSYFSQSLSEQQKVDGIKKQYCSDHNIPLLKLKGSDYKNMYELIKKYNHKYIRGRVN